MKKRSAFLLYAFFSASICAQVIDPSIAEKLNAKRVIQVLPERCEADGITVPKSVWYVKEGDRAPSCGLLLADGKYIDLVSPEPGTGLPACAKGPGYPRVVRTSDPIFVYDFSVEDPKSVVSVEQRVFLLDHGSMRVCANEEKLVESASREIKRLGFEGAFSSALKKYGCM